MNCRNPVMGQHGCHPYYARKYDGYCLDCMNAGVPELVERLAEAERERDARGWYWQGKSSYAHYFNEGRALCGAYSFSATARPFVSHPRHCCGSCWVQLAVLDLFERLKEAKRQARAEYKRMRKQWDYLNG